MNAYTATYEYTIMDEDDMRACHIWEAHRLLAIAQAEANKTEVAAMKRWLRDLGWDSKESDTDFRFVA